MGQYEDDMARLRAEFDQARESMRELAGALWALFSELVSEGFDRADALDLTIAWLTEMVRSTGGKNE